MCSREGIGTAAHFKFVIIVLRQNYFKNIFKNI